MTEPGSGPEQPDERSALGREFGRPDVAGPRRGKGRRRTSEELTAGIESPELIDDGDVEYIVEALRAKVDQDPPSLGAEWDEITQQTLAVYWPDDD